MDDIRILYCTWPDEDAAAACARDLVERRLAACVTLIPAARSIYVWEGSLNDDREVVMLAKSAVANAPLARDAILAQHPYELPCVLALTPDALASNAPFMEWVCRAG